MGVEDGQVAVRLQVCVADRSNDRKTSLFSLRQTLVGVSTTCVDRNNIMTCAVRIIKFAFV